MSMARVLGVARLWLSVALGLGSFAAGSAGAAPVVLHGAGSTLSADYVEASRPGFLAASGTAVRYDAVGSGEGIRRVATGDVDFALTDVPLTEFELKQLKLAQIPLYYCGIVVVINLPGVRDGDLRLSGAAIGGLFLGEITRWRDPRIVETNPTLAIPDLPVTVVHRADTSGTSLVFTSFLAGASEAWAQRIGQGSRLSWPAGTGVEGGAGMRDAVRATAGAIGYLEYGNALREGLATAELGTGKDDAVRAGAESFRRTLAARPPESPSHYQLLTRAPTPGAWPMLATEYGLVRLKDRGSAKAEAVTRFLESLAVSPTLADFQFLPYRLHEAGVRGE